MVYSQRVVDLRPWNCSDPYNRKLIDRLKRPYIFISHGLAILVRSVFDRKSVILAASCPLVPLVSIYSNVVLMYYTE